MGMVHRVGSCIQLALQLLYFPFAMPITEDVVAVNRNGNKQKRKKKQQEVQNKFRCTKKDNKDNKINVTTSVFTL